MRTFLKLIPALALAAGAMSAQVPTIAFDSNTDLLKLPPHTYMGEAAGVATNSKGHTFLFMRSGNEVATIGTSRTFSHGGGRLLEFDQNGRFVKEFGQGLYGFLYPNSVRVDKDDNVWVVDRAASLVIKFDPMGRVVWPMGRKPEAVNTPRAAAPGGPGAGGPGGGGRGPAGAPGVGSAGDLFNGPADVAWNAAGEIYVADGYGNARVGKYDKMGHFIKSWGQRGKENGQFDKATSIATDAAGNVYVADPGNKRIQIFDGEGTYKSSITGVGSPQAICVSPGTHQYLYASNSNAINSIDNGEIYKLELDGTILGKFGEAGKQPKQFWTVNQMDCRTPNTLMVGEVGNWRVQKLTLKP